MKYLDLFSGIGGFSEGFRQAGWNFSWVGFSEIYKPAIEIYQRHFPGAVPLGDITKIDCSKLPRIDLITGGFPCQSLSVANPKGKGIDDSEKSGLIWEVFRIAKETQPEWLVLENVRGLLSKSGGRDFARILIELGKLGFHRISWEILDSQNFGVPQRRKRVFIVCSRSGSAPRIFPLGEGDSGDASKSLETGGARQAQRLTAKPGRFSPRSEPFVSYTIGAKNRGAGNLWNETHVAHAIRSQHPINRPNDVSYIAGTITHGGKCAWGGQDRNFIAGTIEHREGSPDGIPGRKRDRVDRSRSRCLGNSVVVPVVRAIATKMRSQTN